MSTVSKLRSQMSRLWADESGATAIEYAVIAAGVAGAIITAVYSLGTGIQDNLYNKLTTVLGTYL